MPVTILECAAKKLNKDINSEFNAQEIQDAGFYFIGGCFNCAASISCANMCPTKSGYVICKDCAGEDGRSNTFEKVEDALEFMFPAKPEKGPCCDCGQETRRHDGERFQCKKCCYDGFVKDGEEAYSGYVDYDITQEIDDIYCDPEYDPNNRCDEHCMNPMHKHKE